MIDLVRIGASALSANQLALSTIGQNIANASDKNYTRQEVNFSSLNTQTMGVNRAGQGVLSDGIRRVYDQYITNQLRYSTSQKNQLSVAHDYLKQMDALLGDGTAGPAIQLQNFLAAFQNAINDPKSSAARQNILNEANSLSNSFSSINNQLTLQKKSASLKISDLTDQVNSITSVLSGINAQLQGLGKKGQVANDLLDQRDEQLLNLSELLDVKTSLSDNGSVNVYLSGGESLVLGSQAHRLFTKAKSTDIQSTDLALQYGAQSFIVTQHISGGALGGTLLYRDQILNTFSLQLNKEALGIADAINQQHQKGLTLTNALGGVFFQDINNASAQRTRVMANTNNKQPASAEIDVALSDISSLNTSDYSVQFSKTVAGSYNIIRQSDNAVVANGALSAVPSSIEFDGLTVTFSSAIPSLGDQFQLSPLKSGADFLAPTITDVRNIALSQPVVSSAALGNRGSAQISEVNVLSTDTDYFDMQNKSLSPPLLIRFYLLSNKSSSVDGQTSAGIAPTTGLIADPNPIQKDPAPTTGPAPTTDSAPTTGPAPTTDPAPTIVRLVYDILDNSNPDLPADLVPAARGLTYTSGAHLFSTDPISSLYTGYQASITGTPLAGDAFSINYNTNGFLDNRNASDLANLNATYSINASGDSLLEGYNQWANSVSQSTHQFDIGLSSAEALLQRAQSDHQQKSGVNLDEEASQLVRFQQAFNASAQLINISRSVFDALLNVF